jgi:hypothetical protein
MLRLIIIIIIIISSSSSKTVIYIPPILMVWRLTAASQTEVFNIEYNKDHHKITRDRDAKKA